MSNKEKREFAEAMLAAEGQFDVCARTGAPAVSIPEYLQREPYVTLTWGMNLPLPIRDFVLDESGITGTLHFGSIGYFWCLVRWEAVRVIRAPSGLGRLWTSDDAEFLRSTESKPEVYAQAASLVKDNGKIVDKLRGGFGLPPKWSTEHKRPHLRLIQGGKGRTNPSGNAA